MNAIDTENVQRVDGGCREGGPVVEVPLLLESRLLTALESAACAQGTTAANMLRRLIRDFLRDASDSPPP